MLVPLTISTLTFTPKDVVVTVQKASPAVHRRSVPKIATMAPGAKSLNNPLTYSATGVMTGCA